MKLSVVAKPRSHEERVEPIDETHFVVAVREPPENGLANLAIRAALAGHLKISASRLTLVRGFGSKHKLFDLA